MFLVTIPYKFKLPDTVAPKGSLLLASALPKHELQRRPFERKHPHLANRFFDPQLYLAELEPARAAKHCANLASYPWFGVAGLRDYSSAEQRQTEWRRESKAKIGQLWPGRAADTTAEIRAAVNACVQFQVELSVQAILLPSPLTRDPASDYSREAMWLDAGIQAARSLAPGIPVFATIAVSDVCLQVAPAPANPLVGTILDSVGAREVDGAYIVVEQAMEDTFGRHCATVATLRPVLEMVHLLATDCSLRVGVGFLGAFGLACLAAGAEFWSSGWYKSLYRLRLADSIAGGRAFPHYWSTAASADISLAGEFDLLAKAGRLGEIEDSTVAAEPLLRAARAGISSDQVPAWAYRQGNISAAEEHFLLAVQAATEELMGLAPGYPRVEFVEAWLRSAERIAADATAEIDASLPKGKERKTRTEHVSAWRSAVESYRRDHHS